MISFSIFNYVYNYFVIACIMIKFLFLLCSFISGLTLNRARTRLEGGVREEHREFPTPDEVNFPIPRIHDIVVELH